MLQNRGVQTRHPRGFYREAIFSRQAELLDHRPSNRLGINSMVVLACDGCFRRFQPTQKRSWLWQFSRIIRGLLSERIFDLGDRVFERAGLPLCDRFRGWANNRKPVGEGAPGSFINSFARRLTAVAKPIDSSLQDSGKICHRSQHATQALEQQRHPSPPPKCHFGTVSIVDANHAILQRAAGEASSRTACRRWCEDMAKSDTPRGARRDGDATTSRNDNDFLSPVPRCAHSWPARTTPPANPATCRPVAQCPDHPATWADSAYDGVLNLSGIRTGVCGGDLS